MPRHSILARTTLVRTLAFSLPFAALLGATTWLSPSVVLADSGPTASQEAAPSEPPTGASKTSRAETADPSAGRKANDRPSRVEENSANLKAKIWWNQPKKVEELGLSEEQRSRMDQSLEAFLAQREAFRDHQRRAMADFGQALAQGQLEAARDRVDSVAEASALPSRLQAEMMIDIVSVLTPAQRQILTERYPKLLSRLWILSVNPRANRVARGGAP